MSEWRLWRGLALLTALLYSSLAWMWLTQLMPDPQDLTPFDGRFFGYTADEGWAYLDALTPPMREAYLGSVRTLDTIFPIALAALLAWPLWRLPPGAWKLLAVLPIGYLSADLIENALIADLLRATERVTAEAIEAASQMTIAKYGFLIISAIALGAVYVTTRTP